MFQHVGVNIALKNDLTSFIFDSKRSQASWEIPNPPKFLSLKHAKSDKKFLT